MEVIVLDEKGNYIRSLKGTYANGVFKWNNGGILSKDMKTIELNFAKKVGLNKKVNSCLVIFNGKDYKQTTIQELKDVGSESKSLTDYGRDYKISEMTKQMMLTKPKNQFKDLLEIIMLIGMIIVVIATYFIAQDLSNSIHPTILAVNKTLAQNQIVIQQLKNQTNIMIQLIQRLTQQGSIPVTVP
jgi:hypothetical protein